MFKIPIKDVNGQQLPDLTVKVKDVSASHWWYDISSWLWNRVVLPSNPPSVPWAEVEHGLSLAHTALWPAREHWYHSFHLVTSSALGVVTCKEAKRMSGGWERSELPQLFLTHIFLHWKRNVRCSNSWTLKRGSLEKRDVENVKLRAFRGSL